LLVICFALFDLFRNNGKVVDRYLHLRRLWSGRTPEKMNYLEKAYQMGLKAREKSDRWIRLWIRLWRSKRSAESPTSRSDRAERSKTGEKPGRTPQALGPKRGEATK